MSGPVPYTRDAIRQIRAGATARDLGWSSTMYDRVCREQGISRGVQVDYAKVVRASEDDGLRFDRATGEAFAHGIVVALPKGQAAIFSLLFELHAAGGDRFIKREEVATAQSRSLKTISDQVQRLNAKLKPLGISIETRMGNAGGYRLRVPSQSVASR